MQQSPHVPTCSTNTRHTAATRHYGTESYLLQAKAHPCKRCQIFVRHFQELTVRRSNIQVLACFRSIAHVVIYNSFQQLKPCVPVNPNQSVRHLSTLQTASDAPSQHSCQRSSNPQYRPPKPATQEEDSCCAISVHIEKSDSLTADNPGAQALSRPYKPRTAITQALDFG